MSTQLKLRLVKDSKKDKWQKLSDWSIDETTNRHFDNKIFEFYLLEKQILFHEHFSYFGQKILTRCQARISYVGDYYENLPLG